MKKFTKSILQILTGIATASTLCVGKVMAFSVQEGAEAARAEGMPENLVGANGVITQFTSIALYIVGFISVVMLIWGGLRYILSGGDSKKITDAKNTILYALIGLVIAFFAYAIVHFVLNGIGAVEAPAAETTEEAALLLQSLIG